MTFNKKEFLEKLSEDPVVISLDDMYDSTNQLDANEWSIHGREITQELIRRLQSIHRAWRIK